MSERPWWGLAATMLLLLGATASAAEPEAAHEIAPGEAQNAQEGQEAQGVIPVQPLREEAKLAPPTEEEAGRIDEVIVTATRRQQSINSVPVAVTEVGGERLEMGVIRDTRSLSMEIPSLNIAVSGSEITGSNIRIRGVGTAGSNAGFESSVGVFVDGIYLPRPGLALNDLVDVERIEVLRGPQGTLFGKNTSVGAINIYTNKPGELGEAKFTATAGNFGAKIGQIVLSGPVTDSIGLRVAGQYNRQEGYIHNLHDDQYYNDRERYMLRGQALIEPTLESSLRLIVDRIHKDERCCATPYTLNGARPAAQIEGQGGTVFEPVEPYTVAFDHETFSRAEETGASADFNVDISDLQLRIQAGYRESDAKEAADGDKNDLDIVRVPFQDSTTKLMTGELSLHGEYEWLDWLVGAFVSDEEIGFRQSILLGDDAGEFIAGTTAGSADAAALLGIALGEVYAGGTGQTLTLAQQTGKSWSLFTHDVVQLGAGFDLTLGLRYLRENKDGSGFSESNSRSCAIPAGITTPTGTRSDSLRALCAAPYYEGHFKDSRVTSLASLGKTFDGGSYLYGSWSTGFKAGGVNLNPPGTARYSTTGVTSVNTTFEPEQVEAYELGVKLPLFGHQFTVSTALFYMTIEDFQISVYDGIAFVIGTGNVKSKGVEFESRWNVTDWLRLRGAFTYADSVYDEGTKDTTLIGKTLTNAPERVGQLGADLRVPLLWSTDLIASVVGRYQSEVNTGADLNPNKVQEAYTLVNGRLGFNVAGNYELSFWGANLTDTHYNSVIFNAPNQAGSFTGSVGLPRTFGLDLRAKF